MSDWLASEECASVFKLIKDMLLTHFPLEQDASTDIIRTSRNGNYTIFIAGDNERVKEELGKYLQSSTHTLHFQVLMIVTSNGEGILHIGAEEHTHDEDVMKTLAFDWYLISLSRLVLGWRLGGATLQSTFLHSAQRMGCHDTHIVESTPPVNEDRNCTCVTPSQGFVIQRHKRSGALVWVPMFQYGVTSIEDMG